jgi:hypothetical protein
MLFQNREDAMPKTKSSVSTSKRWVKHVADTSDAMDLEKGLFKGSPKKIAAGLKKSVMASKRTKGTKFQSAMSMLNFFINRGGKGLAEEEKDRLERAKPELRKLFGKDSD